MAKTINQRPQARPSPASRQQTPDRPDSKKKELPIGEEGEISLVCYLLCEKHLMPAEIAEEIRERFQMTEKEYGRTRPYKMINEAARRGWLRFRGQQAIETEFALKTRFDFLHGARVIRSAVHQDIAQHAARVLFELARDYTDRGIVRVGVAGGHLLRYVFRRFADLVQETPQGLPTQIVLHSLVAGFSDDPTADPNSFFQFFRADKLPSTVQVQSVPLHAPGFIPTEKFAELRTLPIIKDAFDEAAKIDIFISSAGGCFNEGHSMLYKMFKRMQDQSLAQCRKAHVIGDLMWHPFSKEELDIHTDSRAMTLFDLSHIPKLIGQGKKFILAIAPCGSKNCAKDKGEALRALLAHSQRKALITHLVTDSRSAKAALET